MANLRSQKKSSFIISKFTRLFSIRVATVLNRYPISPNQITVVSFILGIGAFLSFSIGSRNSDLLGAALFFLSFLLDCTDGDLARLKNKTSVFGEWMDAVMGRLEIVLLYFGVCLGQLRYYSPAAIWSVGFMALAGLFVSHSLLSKNAILEYKHKDILSGSKNGAIKKCNLFSGQMNIKKSLFREILNQIFCGQVFILYALFFAVLFNKMLAFLWSTAIFLWIDYFLQVFTTGRKMFALEKNK